MVAAKSEYLAEGEIYKRFIETRDCFLQKGDQLGDRYDSSYDSSIMTNTDYKRYDAVLLFAAGAFAGAIFINGEPIVHKGMTRYNSAEMFKKNFFSLQLRIFFSFQIY